MRGFQLSIVETAVFDRLVRPSFFDQAVGLILSRIAARLGQQGSGNSQNPSCASAPQEIVEQNSEGEQPTAEAANQILCASAPQEEEEGQQQCEHALVLPSYVGRGGGRATVDSGDGSVGGSETSFGDRTAVR
jgi:hypothetical protein